MKPEDFLLEKSVFYWSQLNKTYIFLQRVPI